MLQSQRGKVISGTLASIEAFETWKPLAFPEKEGKPWRALGAAFGGKVSFAIQD